MTYIPHSALSRRTFLKASGAALALPCSMPCGPRWSDDRSAASHDFICTNLGVLDRHFFPVEPGVTTL